MKLTKPVSPEELIKDRFIPLHERALTYLKRKTMPLDKDGSISPIPAEIIAVLSSFPKPSKSEQIKDTLP